MVKSTDIVIRPDGQIFVNGVERGFIDDETVYVFERGSSRPLGTIDHRSEAVALVTDWMNGKC